MLIDCPAGTASKPCRVEQLAWAEISHSGDPARPELQPGVPSPAAAASPLARPPRARAGALAPGGKDGSVPGNSGAFRKGCYTRQYSLAERFVHIQLH